MASSVSRSKTNVHYRTYLSGFGEGLVRSLESLKASRCAGLAEH